MADPSRPPADTRSRATALLVVGAGTGLLAAAVGLMAPADETASGLPEGAVAAVNGRIVRVEEYRRAVAALASDRREPIGDTERRHVLDRLLEEDRFVVLLRLAGAPVLGRVQDQRGVAMSPPGLGHGGDHGVRPEPVRFGRPEVALVVGPRYHGLVRCPARTI